MTSNRFSSLRVLLVDDNTTNRMIAEKLLMKLGIEAEAVGSGAEAVAAASAREYGLIFMDCMMPDMDGYEATRLIRDPASNSKNLQTPIIALTANAMLGDRETCIEAGMSDYLAKPFSPKDLLAAIAEWVPGGL